MAVPLCYFRIIAIGQIHENIQLIIEIIEDYDSGAGYANIQNFLRPSQVCVHQFPQQITKLAGGLNGFVFPQVPASFTNFQILRLVILDKNILMVRYSRSLKVHIYKHPFTQAYQSLGVQIPVNFRKLGKTTIDYVFIVELRPVFIEPVCNKHRNVICPAISRSSAQKNPVILLRDFQEGFDPLPAANNSLLIENEKCVFHASVLSDVVP